MTPIVRRAFLTVLPVLMACVLSAGSAKAQDDIVLTPKQVAPRTWFFQGESGMASTQNKGFMSNAGFVVTADGVVVFDALGTPALGRAMLAAIRKITPQPVKRVIVSHYHATTSTGSLRSRMPGPRSGRSAGRRSTSVRARRAIGWRSAGSTSSPGATTRPASSLPTSGSTATPTSGSAASRSRCCTPKAPIRPRT